MRKTLIVGMLLLIGAGCRGASTQAPTNPVLPGANPPVVETGVVRAYTLTAAPMKWELKPGLKTDAYAYNGQVPGPEIRVKQGDRVKVTLINKLDVPTTIHWHGVRVPADMDGVPGVSQEAVPPGGTFVYDFVAPDVGTFFYHSHENTNEQVDLGLYGPLIVEPVDGAPADAVVALDDWLIDANGKRLPTTQSGPETDTDNLLDTVSEATRPLAAGEHMMPDGTKMGGMPSGGMMMDDDAPPEINGRYGNVLAANGKTGAAVAPIALPKDGTTLLRLLNASNSMTHVLKADDGRMFEIVADDGTVLPNPVRSATLTMPPAKRFDVLLRDESGKPWSLIEKRGASELKIPVVISGQAGPEPSFVSDAPMPPDMADRTPDALVSLGTDRMMDPTTWTIDGAPYDMMGKNAPIATFRRGTWVKMRFQNATQMSHQMHLHGAFMTVIARDGKPVSEAFRQDVVVVRAHETVDVAVLADSPGEWVLHCHNLEHEEHGLMAKIRIL